jgi:hypothetical protein
LFDLANQLDFSRNPRPSLHCAYSTITICIVKEVEERVKWAILANALSLRLNEFLYNEKKKIGQALTKIECYTAGYHVHLGGKSGKTFVTWWYRYVNSRNRNSITSEVYIPQNKTKISYISNLETRFPGFLIGLFRYATAILGTQARMSYIYNLMNEEAKLDFEGKCRYRGTLKLTKHHFYTFFQRNNGFLKAHVYKPLLSDKQMEDRVNWCKEYKKSEKRRQFSLLLP